LQERFVFGHITQELYEKFSAKLPAERQPLEAELEKVDGNLSNLSQYIEKSLLIASKLRDYWKEGDYNIWSFPKACNMSTKKRRSEPTG
jgi:hypothetical protein